MKWPTFVTAIVLTVGLAGCGFFGGDEEETPAATGAAAAVDTITPAEAELEQAPALEQEPAAAPAEEPAAAPAQQPVQQPTRTQPATTAANRPWTPTQAGTVDPGMTREQVVQAWGAPAVERAADNWLYMHYRNGCEVTCGTDDVVLLQDGQVVDAIVRWQGHTYSGVSSSPPGREAVPTLPQGGMG
jgi:hypothetical protein